MRNISILFILLLCALVLLAFVQPQWVAEPLKDGTGPLAIKIDSRLVAPEYHSPLEWWKTHHMDMINNRDFTQTHCLQCHDVRTSCNNCHGYVGVKAVTSDQ